ncbi:MAG: malectin domain-containing carbohydrate-binding protein [Planctomycetota bacterium]|nr:malectin domain-containing carbohydrate-binding protein [Planctomycetota bacterium]
MRHSSFLPLRPLGLVLLALSSASVNAAPFQGGPTVAFSPSQPSTLLEGGLGVDLVIELSAIQGNDVSVPFDLTGIAVEGSDYVVSPLSPLVIPAGSASVTLNLVATVDGIHEGDEGLVVTLLTPSGADLGAPFEHNLTLLDADLPPLLSFDLASSSVLEGAGTHALSISLDSIPGLDVTVPFTIRGTAVEPADFGVDVSPVVISAGSQSVLVNLNLVDDLLHELDETLVVELGIPTNASLGLLTSHSATIMDNDAAPALQFELAKTLVTENQGTVMVRVELDAPSGLPVIFSGTLGGGATFGIDYNVPAGPFQINPGGLTYDVPVDLLDDADVEGTELLRLELDPGLLSGATVGALGVHRMRIRDDESTRATVTPMGLQVAPNLVVLPQTRAGELSLPETITITNTGLLPRTVLGLEWGGVRPEQFDVLLVDGPGPHLLAPGESTELALWFAPDASGHHGAWLRVLETPGGDPGAQVVAVNGFALGTLGEDILMCSGPLPFTTVGRLEYAPEYGSDGAGTASSHSRDVAGTEDDGLYQELREGPQLGYAFALPSGPYEVIFHFAEPEHTLTGQRVFEIAAEGEVLIPAYDVIAAAGQVDMAVATEAFPVVVNDGVLNLSLTASVDQALFQAIEIRAIAVLEFTPGDELDFGTVDQGVPFQLLLDVQNSGLLGAHVTELAMLPSIGSAQDFGVELEGTTYSGADVDVIYPLDFWIQAGDTLQIPVTFTPTEHEHHHFDLVLSGGFVQTVLEVHGEGGSDSNWGFLHPTITSTPALLVDYDGDGSELVSLSGATSHTHEPGRSLVGFDWESNGVPFASSVDASLVLPLGLTDLSLTITDDGTPPFSATVHEVVQVHSADQVPEVLALYYHDPLGNPGTFLDAPPAMANHITRIAPLRVTEMMGAIGASPFTADVMLELRCIFEVNVTEPYHFVPLGGTDTRVFVDGIAHSAEEILSPGTHTLVARFAVGSTSDLPAALVATIAGLPVPDFAVGVLHDENGIVPVIHSMPSLGLDTGGTSILIEGFGFYPQDQLTLHWGSTSVPASSLAAYTAERLLFVTPPGNGTISVWVQTPAGSSNAVDFEYSSTGPVPIVWDDLPGQAVFVWQPTCAAFGPDGRLYVGQLTGNITALTLDSSWNVLSSSNYAGVSNLMNHDLLGIAFDPYDSVAGGDLKVYVGHGTHYANGGGIFSGPSPYSGQVSVLEGPNFDVPVPVITGLPVSNHDHGINGIVFDHDGNLLVAVGGNTNAGIKWPLMGDLPESPLSGAVIRAPLWWPSFDGDVTYAIRATGVPSADQADGEISELDGGDVVVVASGLRNSYDLVLTTKGLLYATDNGPNFGYGPASTGASSAGGLPHPDDSDELVLMEDDRYFGHPNRARGHTDDRQNYYYETTDPSIPGAYTAPLTSLDSSADGIVEYRSAAFGGQLRGDLISQKWNAAPRWVQMSDDGRSALGVTILATGANGLDVTTGPGGALICADQGDNKVRFIVPAAGLSGSLSVFDIHPWRAPETGGAQFVLGGRSFGDLLDTSVFFGGVSATLISVEPTRIVGILPSMPGSASATLMDISVQVGATQSVLPEAFRWLPATRGWSKGAWSTGQDLPDALGEVAAGVVDGRVILVGEGTSKTYAMDLATGVWDETLAQRPFVGHHHAAEVIDGKLYLFGSVGSAWGKVQIYDPQTDSWTTGADMPWGAGSCSSALIDGLVYVCGGITVTGTVGDTGVYDPVLDSWNPNGPLPLMPTPVNHAASATDGTYLWVFGGRAGGNWPQPGFDNVQRFDPATGIWVDSSQPMSPLSPMPIGRGGTGRAVWHGQRFFIFGGETSSGQVFDSVQVYTAPLDQWTEDTPLPSPRHGLYPVVDGNRIFVIGGGVAAGASESAITEILQR